MPIIYRRMSRDEALESADIIVQAYARAPWHEEWCLPNAISRIDELTTTPMCLAVAACDGKQTVGFAFGLPHTSVVGRGIHVAEIAIRPEHQRCGIGSRLLQQLEGEARAMGYVHVWLVSRSSGGVAEYYRSNHYSHSEKLCVYSKQLR
ncbi:GNAT family N-acetyltransferase [Rhizobium cauense]|uniref:GNAT family N-acetyltransferase n=1 Tax=Rhizobium cauense TaxID=1166683 RepID=UPI001C6EB93D|nr:GNAT family N-acetyltransferase [Rhizobium cauense]MBW9113389.1 GNAT family N-acetyltransferase [Rhizobium cauense]